MILVVFSSLLTWFMWRSKLVHSVALVLIFAMCVWSGANYYFHVFSERHQKWKAQAVERKKREEEEADKKGRPRKTPLLARSTSSFVSFVVFSAAYAASGWVLLHHVVVPMFPQPTS